jgi:hypothetical protein
MHMVQKCRVLAQKNLLVFESLAGRQQGSGSLQESLLSSFVGDDNQPWLMSLVGVYKGIFPQKQQRSCNFHCC